MPIPVRCMRIFPLSRRSPARRNRLFVRIIFTDFWKAGKKSARAHGRGVRTD